MRWPTRPAVLCFDDMPGIPFVLPDTSVDVDEMSTATCEAAALEIEVDYMEIERKRIVAELLSKKLQFEENRARARRANTKALHGEVEMFSREYSDEEDEEEMRLPEGSRCRICRGRVQYGVKMKYGCRDRNRGHAVCNGECHLKEMRRSARCKICRKDIVQGSSDRKYCNGMCAVRGARRKTRRGKAQR